MKKYIFPLAGLILFSIIVYYYWPKPKQEKPFQVGVILSLSGKGAVYGERSKNGFLIAQQELNKNPFFINRNLELIIEDSKSNPSDALSAFNKLVSINRVPVVVGMVLSDEVLSCAETANKYKVVILTPGAGSTKITEAGEYIYRNRESAEIQASAIADACLRLNKTKIAIFYSQASNGISYKDSFKKSFISKNGQIAGEESFNEGLNDYRPEIKRIMKFKSEGVYLAGLDREIALIIKQSLQIGYRTQFFASAGAVSPKLIEIAGPAAEGLITVSESFDPSDPNTINSPFVKLFKQQFNNEPEWVSANSYEALKIIGKLFENGCRTGEDFKNTLDTIKFKSFNGTIKFDTNGDVQKSSRLIIIKNGQFSNF
jgi:branched-chain amino acid transport system substrate-binding protein